MKYEAAGARIDFQPDFGTCFSFNPDIMEEIWQRESLPEADGAQLAIKFDEDRSGLDEPGIVDRNFGQCQTLIKQYEDGTRQKSHSITLFTAAIRDYSSVGLDIASWHYEGKGGGRRLLNHNASTVLTHELLHFAERIKETRRESRELSNVGRFAKRLGRLLAAPSSGEELVYLQEEIDVRDRTKALIQELPELSELVIFGKN